MQPWKWMRIMWQDAHNILLSGKKKRKSKLKKVTCTVSFHCHLNFICVHIDKGSRRIQIYNESWRRLREWISFFFFFNTEPLSFFFLSIKMFFFLILFFNITILYWFCHISKWICHRYTRVPHPEPSSLFPPQTIPLGCPSVAAPSIQYHTSNLDWRLVSCMILYMFQCHSPKSSHPLPLPQSRKDCSIHQCLFCCLVHRVIVTIFLNSIYMR